MRGLSLKHTSVHHGRSKRAPKLIFISEPKTPPGKDLWTNEPLPPPEYPPPPSHRLFCKTPVQEKKPNLEEMLTKLISVSETRFQNTEIALKNQQASIQGLETQMAQLSKLISERPQGSLPSNTEPTQGNSSTQSMFKMKKDSSSLS
ncbi:hypothetical protein GOBAR_AA00869 [Gossypium barbadense]|uniref:Uncharacterized protein n=1 Tax=Gossypium barbadense TaxID=3634 RepID=A0A2P5YVW0_GOSBA|nr:hypothetical protein GOBAR_AA00869 [Gossypium barbadense]